MGDDVIRVAIVDDQPLVRMGFRLVLEAEPWLEVVAEAEDGRAAQDLPEVDVVLMDVRMPVLDGIEATKRLLARPGAPRVLVLTTFDVDADAVDAIRAGASGFLLKDARPQELMEAIRAVHRGDAVLAPRMTRVLMDRVALEDERDDAPVAELPDLTEREREFLVAIAEGCTNTELAERFVVAESTVKTHVRSLLQKLGARDRVQLVIAAFRGGLVR